MSVFVNLFLLNEFIYNYIYLIQVRNKYFFFTMKAMQVSSILINLVFIYSLFISAQHIEEKNKK